MVIVLRRRLFFGVARIGAPGVLLMKFMVPLASSGHHLIWSIDSIPRARASSGLVDSQPFGAEVAVDGLAILNEDQRHPLDQRLRTA